MLAFLTPESVRSSFIAAPYQGQVATGSVIQHDRGAVKNGWRVREVVPGRRAAPKMMAPITAGTRPQNVRMPHTSAAMAHGCGGLPVSG
jgi:hypothetical protein